MVRSIITYGDPILRKKTKQVTDFSHLEDLYQDMFDTMYEEEGIGLAANQIGIDLNLMVIDISHTEEFTEPMVIANAYITDSQGEDVMEEGCLSLPEIRIDVIRPEEIVLKYQDETGKQFENAYDGFMARVLQHEIDHLNGVMMIDYLSPLQIKQYKNQLQDLSNNQKAVAQNQFSRGIIL
jgi:peptide deformylase